MGEPRILLHSQLRNSYNEKQFHRVHVSPQNEGNVPSSGAQKAVFRLDQGDLVRREAERFIAHDKIALAIQIPPLIFVFGTERVRRKF